MYLKWSIILSIFEGHRVVLVVPNSNTNVCCSSPLIVGLAIMTGKTGIRSNIQSFPLATLPRQNFSARNICCLFVRLYCDGYDWRNRWTFNQSSLQSFSWMSSRCKKNLWSISSTVLRCSEAQLYDTRRQQHFFLSCDKMIAEKRAVVRRPMVTVDSGRSCERNIFSDGT